MRGTVGRRWTGKSRTASNSPDRTSATNAVNTRGGHPRTSGGESE